LDGKNYIETVWGRGYVLREPREEDEFGNPVSNAASKASKAKSDGDVSSDKGVPSPKAYAG